PETSSNAPTTIARTWRTRTIDRSATDVDGVRTCVQRFIRSPRLEGRMPLMPRHDGADVLGCMWHHRLTLGRRHVAQELLEPRLREEEGDRERLRARIPQGDTHILRDVDRGARFERLGPITDLHD